MFYVYSINSIKFSFITIVLVALSVSCTKKTSLSQYPEITPILSQDSYHGQEVIDPYRNLENSEDSVVVTWMKAQTDHANQILNKINGRDFFIDKQRAFDAKSPFIIYSTSITLNGKYFYMKRRNDESYGKLYYRNALEDKEQFLFDSAAYRDGGYRINYIKPDWKGEKVAIGLSKKGEEIGIIIIINVSSKQLENVEIRNASPSSLYGIHWLPNNNGFTYIHIPFTDPNDPNYWLETKSVLYMLGTNPKNLNVLVDSNGQKNIDIKKEDFPAISIYGGTTQYLFLSVAGSTPFKTAYFKKIEDIENNTIPWTKLYAKEDMVSRIIPDGDDLYFLTAKDSPNFKIGKTTLSNPNFDQSAVVIHEYEDEVITDVELNCNGLFYVTVKQGIEATLHLKNKTEDRIIEMPRKSGRLRINAKGSNSCDLWVAGSGWLNQSITYLYNVENNSFKSLELNKTRNYPEFENLEIVEIEIPSHDGVMVPLSIIKQQNIPLDGSHPTLFYGYGSYGVPTSPFFLPTFLTWIAEGGIIAVPHVRGGGEKGDAWHKAGMKTTKSNTWKDLIATTEYMIEQNYTSPDKTIVWGTSAGGIMAGRAMTERPDLYKAVLLISPAMNMLRSEIQPNGLNSIKEFGTVKIEEEFKALLEMDSYHHIEDGVSYPSVYISAGAKDGRVVVWDPAKFVARLQRDNTSNNPILFQVDFDAGHGGLNNSVENEYTIFANALAFAFWQTDHKDYQLNNE